MKKFYCLMIALVMTAVMASAQTVESSRFYENTYVSVFGGATTTGQPALTPFFWDGAKNVANSVRPLAGIEIGKYFTPVVGFSVEAQGLFGMHERVVEGSDPTKYVGLDQSAVLANGKINFSNWFGGYKGQPRRVEVVGVAGAGWGHNFDEEAEVRHSTVYKAGAELNFNMGKARAWQINVRPAALWNNTRDVYPKLSVRDMDVQVTAGITYKFGSKSKGHNFRLCPYSVTQADYDAVVAERDALKNRAPEVKEVVRETIRTERVIEKETRVLVGSTVITFPIGSAVLSEVERQKVAMFAKSLDGDTLVQIVGSADSGTGSVARNNTLAQNRANVVKNMLTDVYGIAPSRISTDTRLDATENPETSRSAILTLSVE